MSQALITTSWALRGVQFDMVQSLEPKTNQLGFAVARVAWLWLVALMLVLITLFAIYFWHWAQVKPCYLENCSLMFEWFKNNNFPVQIYGLLYLIALVLPALIWIGLGIWIFLAQPRLVWSLVFSIVFILGWYGEINQQYIRGSLPDVINFNLEIFGFGAIVRDPQTIIFSNYLRGILKMLADNLLLLLVFAFPSGRLRPPWTIGFLLFIGILSLGYSLPFLRQTNWNYTNWGFPWAYLLNLGWLAGLIWGVWLSYSGRDQLEQRQFQAVFPVLLVNMVLYGAINVVQWFVIPHLFPSLEAMQIIVPWILLFNKYLNGIAMIWLAVAVAQTIVHQQLFDIRFVLNRAVAFTALFLSSALIYGLIIGGLGSLFRQSDVWLSILATGIIAVLFHPMLVLFRAFANKLFYGERHDPYRAISNLGRQLEAVVKPEELTLTIVQTVASTLRLPYVALTTNQQTVAIGTPIGQILEFPMLVKGQNIGALLVSSRFIGDSFSFVEMRLLEDLAARAAASVQDALLTQEVQTSKEAIVFAREEERKRIRRDLHDGLGPALASLSMNLQISKQFILKNPTRAEEMVVASAQSVQDAMADIRRLVYDLRPPALDDLGLEGALRQQIGQMLGITTQIHISPLESLPAAIEVAIYRITCEALNNVAKHAQASQVQFNLYQDQTGVLLEITDNGIGLHAPNGIGFFETRVGGLGLHSMRERAVELGGKFELETQNGTRVLAWLPVRKDKI